jgi:hypothetical protein
MRIRDLYVRVLKMRGPRFWRRLTTLKIKAVGGGFGESNNEGAIGGCDSSGIIPLQVVGSLGRITYCLGAQCLY